MYNFTLFSNFTNTIKPIIRKFQSIIFDIKHTIRTMLNLQILRSKIRALYSNNYFSLRPVNPVQRSRDFSTAVSLKRFKVAPASAGRVSLSFLLFAPTASLLFQQVLLVFTTVQLRL